MTKVQWDKTGERLYETGVDHGVLYPLSDAGEYDLGFAWNGLTAVTQSPSGAEATAIYADNIKYLNLISAEEFSGTIEAFMSPVAFDRCDGSATPVAGVSIGQQRRQPFGLSWRTLIGNDVLGTDYGYKIHLAYGATASPSERSNTTVNETPEALSLSWAFSTVPVEVPGLKPSAHIVIDSTTVDAADLAVLEDILYGTEGNDPRLPLPDEVIAIFEGGVQEVTPAKPAQVGNVVTIPDTDSVVYKINGVVVEGAYTLTANRVIKASPAKGYIFPDVVDADWMFIHTP